MLDNQSQMRSMLDLIESVDQGKKIKQLNESKLNEGSMKRWLEDRALSQSKSEFVSNCDEYGMSSEEAAEFWINVNGGDEELDEGSGYDYSAEDLADDALSAAARSIQDALGVKHGDFAGMYFTGEIGDTILKILTDYAREEMRMSQDDEDDEQLRTVREDYSKLEEAASRKDFRQVADIIKEIPDEAKRRALADHHCEIFKQQNPRFSREKFMKYIGLADESLNEDSGNTVQVTFVNSGRGITGEEKPQTVEKLGMDIDQIGRPILFIKSPAYGDKMRADWDAKNNRWIVDQD